MNRKKYGGKKSHSYLIDKFPQYADLRSVLIDNWAMTNAGGSSYSHLYSVKPFTPRIIAQSYGAFNQAPSRISDIDLFLKTKGLDDDSEENSLKEKEEDFFTPAYGDTVLLALIERLGLEVFGGQDKYDTSPIHTQWFSYGRHPEDDYDFLMYTHVTDTLV